jgi:cytochrome b6-f complex iron-sulfur subunit
MERKEFIQKTLCLCGLAFIPAAAIESCNKQSFSGPANVNFTLDLSNASNAALNAPGGYLVTNGVLVIRYSTSAFDALSATCTHQGCTVGYDASSAKVVCPCHGGIYDPNSGNVVSGPPPSPLTKYTVAKNGNTLTIKS